jgi:hypothetical protein
MAPSLEELPAPLREQIEQKIREIDTRHKEKKIEFRQFRKKKEKPPPPE